MGQIINFSNDSLSSKKSSPKSDVHSAWKSNLCGESIVYLADICIFTAVCTWIDVAEN